MVRRRWLVASCGLLLAGYLTLTTLTYLTQITRPTGESEGVVAEQYTLPSLEEVVHAVHDLDVHDLDVHDLDVQRVLRMHHTRNPHAPATPPVRVVVSSTWRSGSTLLAEILAAHPGVFYHYEPLMSYGLQQLAPSHAHQGEVERVLQGLLQCDYRHADDYLKFAFVNHEMFVRNTRLWSMCSAMPRTKCYNPDTLAHLCSLFPIHVMKVVRARLDLLAPLLQNPHVRLVWLVRDPRAVMSSRRNSVSWCQTRSCNDPGYLCSDLQTDFSTYLLLKEDFPSQVMLLRYEDLARNPYDKSRDVLHFAGLSFHRQVQEYLDDHLTSDEDEPWSTHHDPRTRVARWMKIMQFDDVVKTQYHCRGIMKNLGYRIFTSKSDMDNGNAVGLLNIP